MNVRREGDEILFDSVTQRIEFEDTLFASSTAFMEILVKRQPPGYNTIEVIRGELM